MAEALFYALALGALLAAGNVVFRRNPVVSTANLVIVFFCLSGIYILIGFPFVAGVQLLVYAGAILVLFLFVILLLNLRREEEPLPKSRLLLGPACAIAFGTLALAVTAAYGPEKRIEAAEAAKDGADQIGQELFSLYLIPFEATGLLLLAAIAGAIMLTRRKGKEAH